MMHATAKIAEGRFDTLVNVQRNDELGHLAASINRMAARLDTFTRGQKRFLGAVAHELRSPIARMQLATGLLERNRQPAVQKHVNDLNEEIQLMTNLTDELLQIAKAETTAPNLRLSGTNVLETVRMAAKREAKEGIDLRIDVDPSLQVKANAEYLVRSLSNILRNAVRYAGNAGPIEIRAESANDQVRIIVADSGPGVPEDTLDRIFTPFFRLDDSRDRRSGGTGLGLSIVRNCVEACGGKVECRNRKPTGLKVEIVLPSCSGGL
jgi:two-component system sensor histidine kinase CpxA